MSRSVDLFIDSPLTVDELGKRLAALTRGSSQSASDAGSVELRAGAVTAELAAHHYVDDGALRLSRYRYALSTRFSLAGSLNDCPEVIFVRHVAELVRQRLGAPALVVLDLELRDSGTSIPAGPGDVELSPRGSSPSSEAAHPTQASEAAQEGDTSFVEAVSSVDGGRAADGVMG